MTQTAQDDLFEEMIKVIADAREFIECERDRRATSSNQGTLYYKIPHHLEKKLADILERAQT